MAIKHNTNYFIWHSLHSNKLTDTSDLKRQADAVYVDSRGKEDARKILHTQFALHSHAQGTGFGISEQEGSPAQSKSDVRAD